MHCLRPATSWGWGVSVAPISVSIDLLFTCTSFHCAIYRDLERVQHFSRIGCCQLKQCSDDSLAIEFQLSHLLVPFRVAGSFQVSSPDWSTIIDILHFHGAAKHQAGQRPRLPWKEGWSSQTRLGHSLHITAICLHACVPETVLRSRSKPDFLVFCPDHSKSMGQVNLVLLHHKVLIAVNQSKRHNGSRCFDIKEHQKILRLTLLPDHNPREHFFSGNSAVLWRSGCAQASSFCLWLVDRSVLLWIMVNKRFMNHGYQCLAEVETRLHDSKGTGTINGYDWYHTYRHYSPRSGHQEQLTKWTWSSVTNQATPGNQIG